MNTTFKDNFNYIVAFVAVLLGLSTFKDIALSSSIVVLAQHFNYFQLSIPFISSMLLASYIGALAMLSKNINFTLFPLTRYLELASYSFAVIGLMYPLLVLVMWLVTLLTSELAGKDLAKSLQLIILLVQGAIALFVMKQLATSKLRLSTEQEAAHIRSITFDFNADDIKDVRSKESIFLKKYEETSEIARALLRLKGYGVAKENLSRVAGILADKNVFDDKDLLVAKNITSARNSYAHTGEGLTKQKIDTMIKELEYLQKKIDDAAYESTK